jgi:hypothetical protein
MLALWLALILHGPLIIANIIKFWHRYAHCSPTCNLHSHSSHNKLLATNSIIVSLHICESQWALLLESKSSLILVHLTLINTVWSWNMARNWKYHSADSAKLLDHLDFNSNYGEMSMLYDLEHCDLDIQHILAFVSAITYLTLIIWVAFIKNFKGHMNHYQKL